MLVLHEDWEEQRANTFLQILTQHRYTAFQPSLHQEKILSSLAPDLLVVQSLHHGIADGRHGNVDVGDIPPDVAHRYLPDASRPQHLAEGPLDAKEDLPDAVRTGTYRFEHQLRAPAGGRGAGALLQFQVLQNFQNVAVLHQQAAVRHRQGLVQAKNRVVSETAERLPVSFAEQGKSAILN